MTGKFYKVLASAAIIFSALSFLPVNWFEKCVDVQIRTDILNLKGAQVMPLQVFYSRTGAFAETNSIIKYVARGRHTVSFRLPVDELSSLRFDFGYTPATLRVSPPKIIGSERQTCVWRADLPKTQIGKWEIDSEGGVLCESIGSDPHVILKLERPVKARGAVNWRACVLWGLIAAFLIWKLSLSLTSFTPLVADNGRVFVFDVLRVVALYTVIVSHVLDIGNIHRWWHGVGTFGVTLFLILSGAGLALGKRSDSYWKFVKKRLAAILPTYWSAYLIMTVFLLLFLRQVRAGTDPLMWLLTISGMDGWLAAQIPGVYMIAGEWYVGFILLIYLLAPFVLKGVQKAPCITVAVICILSGGAFVMNDVLSRNLVIVNPRVWWNPLVRLPEFAFGCVFVGYLLRERKRLLVSAACAVPVLATAIFIQGRQFWGFSYVSFVGFAALFVVICGCFAFLRVEDPARAIVGFLAKHSFSVFLVHHSVMVWILRWCPRPAHVIEETYIVLIAVSTLLVSYLLALLTAGPADLLKRFVFGTPAVRGKGE